MEECFREVLSERREWDERVGEREEEKEEEREEGGSGHRRKKA